jgi:hypothetical protein
LHLDSRKLAQVLQAIVAGFVLSSHE